MELVYKLYVNIIILFFMLVSLTELQAQSFLNPNEPNGSRQLCAAISGNCGTSLFAVIDDQSRIDSILGWIKKEKIETPTQTGSVRPFLSLRLFKKDGDNWQVLRVIHIYRALDSSGNNLHTTHKQRKTLLHLLLWDDFAYLFEDYK